jgi:Mg2+/Co2+ transporter CorB
MEEIPEPGTSILIAGYPIEIVQTKDNGVKVARFDPNPVMQRQASNPEHQ